MAKRLRNYCRNCGDTWFPRGQDLSDRCPTCKSRNVTFENMHRPLAPRSGGCGPVLTALGITALAIIAVFAVAIALAVSKGRASKVHRAESRERPSVR